MSIIKIIIKSVFQSTEEHKWVVTVDLLQKYCTDQIDSIQACAECHMNSWESPDQHVTTVCKMVHPIVWALEKSNSLYWPAKCMTVFESKVIVCFFGSHKHIKVDIMECWLYSREPPTRANGEQQRNAEDLLTAMKVGSGKSNEGIYCIHQHFHFRKKI